MGDTGWHPSPVRKKGGTTEFQATAAAGTRACMGSGGCSGAPQAYSVPATLLQLLVTRIRYARCHRQF